VLHVVSVSAVLVPVQLCQLSCLFYHELELYLTLIVVVELRAGRAGQAGW
jgi:hypothetical protein